MAPDFLLCIKKKNPGTVNNRFDSFTKSQNHAKPSP